MWRSREELEKLASNIEFTLNLLSKLGDYRVATFMTCMGTDALDIHSGLPFASKADDGRINKVLEMWSNQRTKFLSEKKTQS